MKLRWFVLAVILVGTYQYFNTRALQQPDGVLAPEAPVQRALSNAAAFTQDEFLILPQAEFEITARVLSKENYRFGREAELSPIDLALGWGRMSDQQVLDKFEISQSGRFYFWRVKEYPIPRQEIIASSANMHMVPASDEVHEVLGDVREGHVVRLRGYLVNVRGKDGWHWNTSLQRTDTGNGACELIWVEQAEIVG
ncbi:MAG: hypothetical protein PVF75_00245 [Granulosicoccaceae bacterium]|jgi:hypothetical protein